MFNIHSNECFNPMNDYINSYVTSIVQTMGPLTEYCKRSFPARCRLLTGSTRVAVVLLLTVSVCTSPVGSPGEKPATGGCKSTLLWKQVQLFSPHRSIPSNLPTHLNT